MISRDVDFWLDIILEGYITEFVVDTVKSYIESEQELFQGPQGRYFNSLKLWIKMVLCEKGILKINSTE